MTLKRIIKNGSMPTAEKENCQCTKCTQKYVLTQQTMVSCDACPTPTGGNLHSIRTVYLLVALIARVACMTNWLYVTLAGSTVQVWLGIRTYMYVRMHFSYNRNSDLKGTMGH